MHSSNYTHTEREVNGDKMLIFIISPKQFLKNDNTVTSITTTPSYSSQLQLLNGITVHNSGAPRGRWQLQKPLRTAC